MSGRDPVDAAELRVAEALRARAGAAMSRPVAEWQSPRRPRNRVLLALLVVLLGAILVGAGLGLLSLTSSDVLPIIG